MVKNKKFLCFIILSILSPCVLVSGQTDQWKRVSGSSSDGSVFEGSPGGSFPCSVIRDGSEYKMWYTLGVAGISYATSKNGLDWTKVNGPIQNVMVMSGGAIPGGDRFDSYLVTSCKVIKDGETYKMWYIGISIADHVSRIGYAYSSDGINWNKVDGNGYLKSVISNEKQGNETHIAIESIDAIKDGNLYKMWYTVYKYSPNPIKMIKDFYYATSSDGVSWQSQKINEFDLSTRHYSLETFLDGDLKMSIMKDGNKYFMYYSGGYYSIGQGIGFAQSDDGINWTQIKGPYNHGAILVNNTKGFDKDLVAFPCVLKDEAEYKMWYVGLTGTLDPQSHLWGLDTRMRIGLATFPVTSASSGIPAYPYVSVLIGLCFCTMILYQLKNRTRAHL